MYIAAGTMWLLLLDCCCWGRVLLLVCRLCADLGMQLSARISVMPTGMTGCIVLCCKYGFFELSLGVCYAPSQGCAGVVQGAQIVCILQLAPSMRLLLFCCCCWGGLAGFSMQLCAGSSVVPVDRQCWTVAA